MGVCGGFPYTQLPGFDLTLMSRQARARRVSSAVVVQKAQVRSTSPAARAARHPAFSGSRRRRTRRSRSCYSRWAGTTDLGRINLTTRCDNPRKWRSKHTGCVAKQPHAVAALLYGATSPAVCQPSGRHCARSASTSGTDAKTDGGARSG